MKSGSVILASACLFITLFNGCGTDSGYDNSADIAYLEQNALKDGVEVTDSGLQFLVVEEGDGEQPVPESLVRIHYRGRLVNGIVFDSSYERGEPSEFQVFEVIHGFAEGLQLMHTGGEYELVIPANLGYGDNPNPFSGIHPGATLIFDVELLEIL